MRAVQAFAIALCLAFPFVLSACGGGGGDGTPTAMTPPPASDPMGSDEPGAPQAQSPSTPSNASLEPLEALKNIIEGAIADKTRSPAYGPRPAGNLAYSNNSYHSTSGDGSQSNDPSLGGSSNFQSPRGIDIEDEEGRTTDETTPYPIPDTRIFSLLAGPERHLHRDKLSQAWLHNFFGTCNHAGFGGSDCYGDIAHARGHTTSHINSGLENFHIIEAAFQRDYTLSKYDNKWDGITTARTNEICYQGVARVAACSAATLADPTGFLQSVIDPQNYPDATRPPHSDDYSVFPKDDTIEGFDQPDTDYGHKRLHYVNSDVAYLQYSALFLNRTLSIWEHYAGPYCASNPDCIARIESRTGYITRFNGTYNSMGRLSIYSSKFEGGRQIHNIPTGTWNGGMMGVKVPLGEEGGPVGTPCRTGNDNCTFQEAIATRPDVLSGDVALTVNYNNGDLDIHGPADIPYSITFSNISNQAGESEDGWTWTGNLTGGFHTSGRVGARYDEDDGTMNSIFYGPNFEEAGGSFSRTPNPNEWIGGVFGAKRQ